MADPGGIYACQFICPMLPIFLEVVDSRAYKTRSTWEQLLGILRRRYGVYDAQAVQSQLDAAVHNGLLVAVHVKGNVCYKDPESLREARRFSVDDVKKVWRAVVTAVREIGDPEGSTVSAVERHIRLSFWVHITGNLAVHIQRALELLTRQGIFLQLPHDRYKYTGSWRNDNTLLNRAYKAATEIIEAPEPAPSVPRSTPPKTGSSLIVHNTRQRARATGAALLPAELLRIANRSASAPSLLAKRPRRRTAQLSNLVFSTRAGDHPTVPEKPTVVKKRPPENYECAACDFGASQAAVFLDHIQSLAHCDQVGGKMVQCDVCRFRSRKLTKMRAHLQRHGCHAGKSLPSSMLPQALPSESGIGSQYSIAIST